MDAVEIHMNEDTDDQNFIDALVAMANVNTMQMNDMTDEEAGHFVKDMIGELDLVWAIWPDPEHPTGMMMTLISDRFGLFTGKLDHMATIGALAVPDRQHAEELRALVERHSTGGVLN